MSDCSRWAKKFDDVAHIYNSGHGVMCKKYTSCLGNNYAVKSMETCPDCLKQQDDKLSE